MTSKREKPRRTTGARDLPDPASNKSSSPDSAALHGLPERVRRAWQAGWPVIPQSTEKVPLLGTQWTRFRSAPPSPEQLGEWLEEHAGHIASWGFLAGCGKAPLVIDCDDRHGGGPTYTGLKRQGLTAKLKTPGGWHIYVKPPPWLVKTVSQGNPLSGFPGLEVKSGSLVTFWHRDRPYQRIQGSKVRSWEELAQLVPDLAAAIEERSNGTSDKEGEATTWLSTEPAALQLAVARLKELGPVKKSDDIPPQYHGHCPNPDHEDNRPSFYIRLGDDRLLVAYCQSRQCPIEEISEGLGIDRSEFSRIPWSQHDADGRSFRLGSEVSLEEVEWLWPGVLPKGKLTIWEGDPDKGKSTITLDVAARITTGRPMPNSTEKPDGPGLVLVIAGEDDYADTIKPRLIAAGADDSRIVLLALQRDADGLIVPLTLPTGIERVRQAVGDAKQETGLGVQLIIIDPITNYLGEGGYKGTDVDVRRALYPLSELASEVGAALLLVRHLNKNEKSSTALYRGSGSIAFTGAARSTFVVAEHPDRLDTLVLAPVKANLVARDDRLSHLYRMEPSESNPNVPHVQWVETERVDANALLRAKDARRDAPQREEAAQLILDLLSEGTRSATEMNKERELAGLSPNTWKAAKRQVGVVTERKRLANGRTAEWTWSLPRTDVIQLSAYRNVDEDDG